MSSFGGELVLHEMGTTISHFTWGSGEVAGIFGTSCTTTVCPLVGGCATEARIEGNAGVGREAADDGAHDRMLGSALLTR